MNDLFANLITRNSNVRSSLVLQPRLTSHYETREPGDSFEEQTETLFDPEISSPSLELEKEARRPYPQNPIGQNETVINDLEKIVVNRSQVQEVKRESESIPARIQYEQIIANQETSDNVQPSKIYSRNLIDPEKQGDEDSSRKTTVVADRTVDSPVSSLSAHSISRDGEKKLVVHPTIKPVKEQNELKPSENSLPEKKKLENKSNADTLQKDNYELETSVVKIHIGRIEVKAVHPIQSQPAPKPMPAQPKMTLDDYLHQRERRR